ncbi:MAG: GTPase ObgE [Elusimicrobiota bacterium]
MFIDKARIYVTAGSGGSGCISFRREKHVPLGGPDGGNGGKGGDVYIYADPHKNTLLDLTYSPHYKASDGAKGMPSKMYGKSSEDLIIKAPIGTVVYSAGELIADLKAPGQKELLAKGGRGGRGNAVFKTRRHTAPRIAEKGEPGESFTFELELKLIADVGLVGFPNAGKSTFLSHVSSARPKIADYPFTTLAPNLGVVSYGEKKMVVADIPGLIEGAHEGKGLGDEFLRHIQRTRLIIHIVDLFGFDNKPAYKNFKAINSELSKYSKKLAAKPMIIAANKTDLTGAKEKLSELKKRLKVRKIFPISAVSGEGVKELLAQALKTLESIPDEEQTDEIPVKKYIYEPDFVISRDGDVFVVVGKRIEKLAAMTDFKNEDTLRRFHNIIKKIGLEKALIERGIVPGNIVRIGKEELVFER